MNTTGYSPVDSLHPDCPDWQRLGPTTVDAGLRAMAENQQLQEAERDRLWSRGFTRRRVLAGGLGVGVAAIGSQLVTSRVAYAAGPSTGTLVVVFLRGGMDGLSMLVPVEDPTLLQERPKVAIRQGQVIGFDRGFGLHPALAALKPMVSAGQLAAVPAISTPSLTRSHFQAQDCLERGGASSGAQTGWLDRLLAALGPGTTFRAVGGGTAAPRSLLGNGSPVMVRELKQFAVQGTGNLAGPTRTALEKLYTGLDHPLSRVALVALAASDTTGRLDASEKSPTERGFADNDWGRHLASLASLIRTGQGVRVATIDLGGWDMHTEMGTATEGDFTQLTRGLAEGLATFVKDLGPAAATTTILVMSEFGRRVQQNASGGTDHGHGGVAMVLGSGVAGGVKGRWEGLGTLDQGDVPGTNDYRDLLAEVCMKRFGLTPAQVAPVFPDWKPTAVGAMA
ncbi:MAG: DUF1501 domain-containing protein [Actinomycetia bacterium]|nr:DUF1501 domain-containing protein [Actinomycetes bacterium]